MLLIKNTLILHITFLSVSPVCNTAGIQIEEKALLQLVPEAGPDGCIHTCITSISFCY